MAYKKTYKPTVKKAPVRAMAKGHKKIQPKKGNINDPGNSGKYCKV